MDREQDASWAAEEFAEVTLDGCEFINFNCRLGRREAYAGVEYSLYGMREGGYRKVRVSAAVRHRR